MKMGELLKKNIKRKKYILKVSDLVCLDQVKFLAKKGNLGLSKYRI